MVSRWVRTGRGRSATLPRAALVANRRRSVALLLLLAGGAGGCSTDVNVVLERLSEARRLTDELLVQFTKAADASNRAVMADTDEGSVAFAREAKQSAEAAQREVEELRPMLQGLNYTEEAGLLDEFAGRYAKYRELDQRILDLAVENTNLKAQRLAFGPAQQAADAFRDALKEVASSAPAKDAWHAESLAATAVSAVREIQVLQGPHIADADEGGMTRLEGQMAASEKAARVAIASMATLVSPSARPRLSAAGASLGQFMNVNAEIVALSRRNTNVRSLALSLDQKRKLITDCEESLHALQNALGKRGFTRTRRSRNEGNEGLQLSASLSRDRPYESQAREKGVAAARWATPTPGFVPASC